MVTITEQEKELAFRCLVFLVKRRADKNGEKPNDLRREMGNLAKELGVSYKELLEFTSKVVETIIQERQDDKLLELWGKVVEKGN